MRTKFLTAMLAGAFVVAAGAASAEPLRLTEQQLDGINAGAIGIAVGTAAAFGDVIAATSSVSGATAVNGTFAAATNTSTALAASLLFGAATATTSASAAALP